MKTHATVVICVLAVSATGCVTNSSGPKLRAERAKLCTDEVVDKLHPLVGNWLLEIRADEGWTGYGKSSISWDTKWACGIVETQAAVFNQESDTPISNDSRSLIIFDSLTGSLKSVINDTRLFRKASNGSH